MAKGTNSVTHESDKFNLRLPIGMRERVAQEAKRKGWSMNALFIAYVEAGLGSTESINLERSIKNIESDIAEIKKRLARK